MIPCQVETDFYTVVQKVSLGAKAAKRLRLRGDINRKKLEELCNDNQLS